MNNEQLAFTIAGNPTLLHKISNAEIFIDIRLHGKIDEMQKELKDAAFGC